MQVEADMTDRLLDAKEVAARLNVPESWVRAETRAGRMPHVELGRYRRYEWKAIEEWLADHRGDQWRKRRPSIEPPEVLR
jgi:excisionase family DNA binding protein